MTDIDDVKEEFNRLDSKDKRWIFVCLVVAASALLSAALGGSLLGDLIAFVATFAAGWFVHDQWNAVRRTRRAPRRSAGTGSTSKSG